MEANFLLYGFDVRSPTLRDRVVFVKGLFTETLPRVEVEVRIWRFFRCTIKLQLRENPKVFKLLGSTRYNRSSTTAPALRAE